MSRGREDGRTCGACTACCTLLEVPELGKDAFRPCPLLSGSGCGRYALRPDSCRRFECQWLRGVLELDDGVDPTLRPDVCGLMFDYQPDSAFGEMYVAWEVEPGASASGPGAAVLREMAAGYLVLLVSPGGDGVERRFLGPDHRVRRADGDP